MIRYSEKLRDPRWQRKRLEIMQRDNFTCRHCGDSQSTLNVHHLEYNGEPWEVQNDLLITLCEVCHECEHAYRKKAESSLLSEFRKKGFNSSHLYDLSYGVYRMEVQDNHALIAEAIRDLLSNRERLDALLEWHSKEKSRSIATPDDLLF